MNQEDLQRPVIRNMADLNSFMARRLQALYSDDFSEGLVNRMAAIIENGIKPKRTGAWDKGQINTIGYDVEKILSVFAEWADYLENSQLTAGHAACPPPDQALLLELVGALVRDGFCGKSLAVSDKLLAMLSRITATGRCASMINEMAGLICDIVTFSERAGKKKTA
ncbi:MAG: hypothetical protein JXQ80_10745 [Bacteroidales bacterium]|nr:hypothetical protein [Bacteroidales bacterium]